MLHLHELQVLGCVYVVEREAGRLWEKWLIAKTAFPPLDATCPVRARWSTASEVTREQLVGVTSVISDYLPASHTNQM